MTSFLGIDLGGTKIAIARYDAETFKMQESAVMDTPADYDLMMKMLLAKVLALKVAGTVAIGIGVPGLVDKKTQHILTLPNIAKSENRDLAYAIQQKTGLPVTLLNDANAFTLAEALEGAGKGEPVVVGITMGTGVGGGIVINGELYRGAHGYAAEIGHMILKPGEPPFPTDNKRGEVEQFLSGTAMGKRCEAAQKPEEYLVGQVCEFMRPDIFREVAWLVTNLTHLLDPSVIIFGGSAGRALTTHLDAVAQELTHWMLPGMPLPRLMVGTLKDAAPRGAAMMAQKIIR